MAALYAIDTLFTQTALWNPRLSAVVEITAFGSITNAPNAVLSTSTQRFPLGVALWLRMFYVPMG